MNPKRPPRTWPLPALVARGSGGGVVCVVPAQMRLGRDDEVDRGRPQGPPLTFWNIFRGLIGDVGGPGPAIASRPDPRMLVSHVHPETEPPRRADWVPRGGYSPVAGDCFQSGARDGGDPVIAMVIASGPCRSASVLTGPGQGAPPGWCVPQDLVLPDGLGRFQPTPLKRKCRWRGRRGRSSSARATRGPDVDGLEKVRPRPAPPGVEGRTPGGSCPRRHWGGGGTTGTMAGAEVLVGPFFSIRVGGTGGPTRARRCSPWRAGSVHLRARGLDDFRPLLVFGLDQGGKLGRCIAAGDGAQRGQPFLECRCGQ